MKSEAGLLKALDRVVDDLKRLHGEEGVRVAQGVVDRLRDLYRAWSPDDVALEVDADRMCGSGASRHIRPRETVVPWVYVRAKGPNGEWGSFELGELTSASFDQWVRKDPRRIWSLMRLLYGYDDVDGLQEAPTDVPPPRRPA